MGSKPILGRLLESVQRDDAVPVLVAGKAFKGLMVIQRLCVGLCFLAEEKISLRFWNNG